MMKKFFSFLIFGFTIVSAQNYGLIADKICSDISKIEDKDSAKIFLKQQEIILREEHSLIENSKPEEVQKFDLLNHINRIQFNIQRETLKKCGNALISKPYELLPSTKVLDLDDVFNKVEIKKLKDKIDEIRSKAGINIMVMEVDEYYPSKDITDFSFRMLYSDNLLPAKDKGELIIVFNKKEREIRISTDSLSKKFLSDKFLQSLIDNEIATEFRKGNYYQVIENCLTKIENAL